MVADTASNGMGKILRIIHDATELSHPHIGAISPSLVPPTRIADISPEAVDLRSRRAAALLEQVEAINLGALPDEVSLLLQLISFNLRRQADDADRYWLALDFAGGGMFYGMFAWTAYGGGFIVGGVASFARDFLFKTASDADRYLAFVIDVVHMVEQFDARTKGQAERGIYMPLAQLDQAIPLISGLKSMLLTSLQVPPERLTGVDAPHFQGELNRRLEDLLTPALERAQATLGADYRRNAPNEVGLSQYPGGRDLYEKLACLHTTLDLTPEQLHRMGLERMERTRALMAAVREEASFEGGDHAYMNALLDDPAWRAHSVEDVAAMFQRYIERLKPRLGEYFDIEPPLPYGVVPLPEALQGAMTFGYYNIPRFDKPRGDYVFNGSNLLRTQLSTIGALTYHELVPGHHLQISIQQANDAVHPLHNSALYTAFVEGWAEYAATLAGEAGMYGEPAERFGRLVNEAFLTCRLVVDTGMNVLGWSLEQARDYMRENSFLTEKEIRSESLRYSCDIPGHALAYKTGDIEILRLREKMRARLGDLFDIRDFHRAVLSPGPLPIPLLEWHIDRAVDAIANISRGSIEAVG